MTKKGFTAIIAAIAAVVLMVSLISCNDGDTEKSGVTEITELNVPYEGESLKITATEFQIKRTKDFLFIDGSTTASVHFEAENVANDAFTLSMDNITIYTDDVLLETGDLKSSLFGELLSGKKSAGYLEFAVPDNTNTVEIVIRESTDAEADDSYASFKFEVPAVTGSVEGEDAPDIKDKVDGAVSEVRDFISEHDDFVTDIREFISEHDDFVTDIKDYIDGVVSNIKK
ncbi:MAG: hypothetical protein IJ386_07815 [Clostridia bacterium]|nr:hypothetical protein [Clostridia bacterium]